MKKLYFLFLLGNLFIIRQAAAQCGAGYTPSQLNWDNLDFLPSNDADYTAWYTSAARPYSQEFSIGTRRINFTMAPAANITLNGENATSTAEAGSFAAPGQDVQFTTTTSANTTITMTFDEEVVNVRFSLFDVDNSQAVTVSAVNMLLAAQTVIIARANAGSAITIIGSPGTSPVATGPGGGYASNNNNGSINITVNGPVKTITLTLNNAAGNIWLGDIDACVTGSFPTGYRAISRPFTGMPPYILTVMDNQFMLLDPTTGRAKPFFTDPGWTNMNGMAYDPYNRILYYTYSLRASAPGGNSGTKTIYKYSVDNETIGVLAADVTASPLFIPTYEPGVTSGSASFYNGSLYFGVESSNSGRNSGRENTVWKIDFDASQNPVRASQVYAARVDSNVSGSNTLIHDWSDIGVTNNGMLYDFDGAADDPNYYHFDMMSGQRSGFAVAVPSVPLELTPRQLAIDWQENVYNQGGNVNPAVGFVVPYDYNGGIVTAQLDTVKLYPGATVPSGSWGDCSEAFRPLCDFGDAPATYDPDPWSPAVNERDTALRIGATFDREWDKTSSALANADGSDEDGIATVTIFATILSTYQVQVAVYNNTGATATLIGWLDYNGNGVFDATEASAAATVNSSGAMQNIDLMWTGITSTLPAGTYTYLRVRLTSAAHGMTSANATGWYDNGETEDYRVPIANTVLPVQLISFDAKASGNKVELNWSASGENDVNGYEVQRSCNGTDWEFLAFVTARQNGNSIHEYQLTDNNPCKGSSHYRLKWTEGNNQSRYSEIRIIKISESSPLITISPNPAVSHAFITITSYTPDEQVTIQVMDTKGSLVFYQKPVLTSGQGRINLPVEKWPSGTYMILIKTGEGSSSHKLSVRR